jgi:hypothetical protein
VRSLARWTARWTRTAEEIGEGYGLVLLLLLVTLLLSALLPETGWGSVPTISAYVLTSLVALASSHAGHVELRRLAGVMAIALAVAGAAANSKTLVAIGFILGTVLLGATMVTVTRHVLTSEVVGTRILLGAISVYVSLGLFFTLIFRAIARLQHGAFFEGVASAPGSDYVFFSYTTLTTTGYGNLIPASRGAQIFAVMEMLAGQIFLVTLVAGLVSLWRPKSRSRRRPAN